MSVQPAISSLDRDSLVARLEDGVFDFVIIGGGITGAGTAREVALRGMSVALLEAHDFASGTSSRSSKLIHGGLRYLAMADVGLVKETALERKEIFRRAPHLAEPRWMLLPTRSRAGVMKFRVGLTTYEKLGAVDQADLHQSWSAADLEREEPLLDRSRFPQGVAYREYLTDDARLVLANLRSAVARGAAVLNHAAVESILQEGGRVVGVEARCGESGRRLRVRGRCVINAAGPWVEAVRRLEEPEAVGWLALSKGVHVGLPRDLLPLNHVVLMQAEDRRSVFAVPRDGVVYIGTTDTSYTPGPRVWPGITRRDVEYLLAPLSDYLHVEPFAPEDVVTAWAGLRPLIAVAGKQPRDMSRKEEVYVGKSGLVSIAGGKLTGYRPMATSTVEKGAEVLGQSLPEASGDGALPGGDFESDLASLSASLQREVGVSARVADRLVRLYGSESAKVVQCGAEPLSPGGVECAGEVEWGVRVEGALTLEDLLYRRMRVPLYEPRRDAALEPLAARMATLLGWDEARSAAELEQVRTRLADELTFTETEQ
jgi:glycerol-3-phosphate dehydrogenase